MTTGADGLDLDRLLEQELNRTAGRLSGPSPLAGQSAYHAALASGGALLSPVASVTALVSSKVAIAVAATTLVVGGAAVTATAATGSPNPASWGSLVVQVVQGCKAGAGQGPTAANKTASGARDNVGQCVSAFASRHGQLERSLHSHASDARTNHPGHGPTEKPHGSPSTGSGTVHGNGGGKPDHTPGGPPVGAGPPSIKPSPHPSHP